LKFLLDTNVVSELTKAQPNKAVVQWLNAAEEDFLFLSAATLAEVRYGLERLEEGARRNALEKWVADFLEERFEGRILSVDELVAKVWAQVLVRSEKNGRRMAIMDAFQAACAQVHGLTLVTRDEEGFSGFHGEILNPWK
jgi:predicted nucleic acid-binding protein